MSNMDDQSISDSASNATQSTQPRTPSKLESLSRDDLLKFVKKQTLLLQKTKAHNEELTKELENASKVKQSGQDADDSDLAEEHRQLLEAYNQSQLALERSATKISSLTDQIDCMTQKLETVTALYQVLQKDFDSLTVENKKLHSESQVWAQTSEELLALEKTRNEQKRLLDCALCDVQQAEQKLTEKDEVLSISQAKLEEIQKDFERLEAELSRCLATKAVVEKELQAARETVDVTEKSALLEKETTIRELQEALESASQKSCGLESENKRILIECDRLKNELETSLNNYSELLRDKETLLASFESLKTSFDDLNRQCQNSSEELIQLQQCLKDSSNEQMSLQQKNQELQTQFQELQSSVEIRKDYEALRSFNDFLLEQFRKLAEILESPDQSSHLQTNMPELPVVPDQVMTLLSDVMTKATGRCSELARLQQDAVSADETSSKLTNDHANLCNELAAEKTRSEQLSNELKRLTNEVEHLEEDNKELKVRCEAQQVQVDDLRCQLESSRTVHSAELSTQACQSDPNADALYNDIRLKDAAIEQLKSDLDSLKLELAVHQRNSQEPLSRIDATEQTSSDSIKEVGSDAADDVDGERLLPKSQPAVDAAAHNDESPAIDELAAAKQKLAEWEAMMLMLQTERNDVQREVAKLQRQQEEALNAVGELLQYLLDTLLKDRDIFPSVNQSNADDESGILNKLGLVKSIVEEMGFERDEMKEKIHHTNEEIAECKRQKQELLDEHTKRIEMLTTEFSEKQTELLQALELAKTSCKDLQQQLEEKELINRSLSNATDDAEQLRRDFEKTQTEIDKCNKLIADENAEKEELKRQCEELRHQLDSYTSQISASESDSSQIKSELDRVSQANCVLSEKVKELSDDVERYRTLLTDSEKQLEDANIRAQLLQDSIATLRDEIDRSRQQTDVLMTQLGDEEAKNSQVEAERAELASKITSLEEQLKSISMELEESIGKRLSLEERAVSLQADFERKLQHNEDQLSVCNAQLTEIGGQLAESETVRSKLEGELQQCRRDLEEARLSLHNAESELKNKIIEVEQLQQSVDKLAKSSETSTATLTEISSLQQQLKEHEDRETKFKQLALKAKKECAELKNKLEACEKELELTRQELNTKESDTNQSLQYQYLQAEYDQLEAKLDAEKQRANEFESSLKKAAEELSNLRMANVDWMEEKERMKKEADAVEMEKKQLENRLIEKEREVRAEVIQRDQISYEKTEMESRMASLQLKCKEMEEDFDKREKHFQEQLKDLKEKLHNAQKDLQQNSMMDLEIADYERTVQTLHATVAEQEKKVRELQEELRCKEEQHNSLQKLVETAEKQLAQAEERSNNVKKVLVKTKKELNELKQQENEQKTADAQLKGKLEMLTQIEEEQKLQIANLMAENRRLNEKMQSTSELSQRVSQSLELRTQSLERDLELARSELSNVQSEYESYKVRVHSVLKQQKTKASTDSAAERDRSECQRLEKLVEQFRSQLQEQREQIKSLTVDNELIQEENERLQQRITKATTDAEQAERNWRDRIERLNAENAANNSLKSETIQQLTTSNEALSRTYKEQIQTLKEEYGHTIDNLRYRLENAELEIDRLRASRNAAVNSGVTSPERDSTPDRHVDYSRELKVEERQSGEGSESTEDQSFAIVRTPSRTSPPTLLPFEQLLNTQLSDDASSRTGETLDESTYKVMLAACEKQNQHLTVLLNESEAAVLRLTEQASVLKGEIRRLERNQERENSISNMEYLKNVVYKFLTLKNGNERTQLIPVLTTMLKFSPDEKDALVSIATAAEGSNAGAGGERALGGWGTYLNRWSGGIV